MPMVCLYGWHCNLVRQNRICFLPGCDADWIKELAVKTGAWANIPSKSSRTDPIRFFSPYLYRARTKVERFFNRI